MKSPLTRRVWIIALILLVAQGGAMLLLQRARSSEVRPLARELDALPMTIGSGENQWIGENHPLDDETTKAVGARHTLGRIYVNGSRMVSLHLADWDSFKQPTLPHPPTICYVASGAQIVRRESIEIGEKDPIQAELMVVERNGLRSLALYWYAWNDIVCTTRTQACMARLKMIGSSQWPPVVKVLLDTPCVPSESQALEDLKRFAVLVREETKGL